MHPTLFTIGGFPVLSYTVMCVAAMFAAMIPFCLEARRLDWKIPSVPLFVVFCTLFGFLGAHILYAMTHLDEGWDGWWSIFFNFGYGFVWYGGLLAAWLYCWTVARRYRIPPRQMYDVGALGCLVALGVGRWGCVLGGCCYGTPTSLPWGMALQVREYSVDGAPVLLHPTAAYESFYCFAVFAVLWCLRTRKRYDGEILVWYLLAAATGRFFLEFLRGDRVRGFVAGWLSTSQTIALVLIVGALFLSFSRKKIPPSIPDKSGR